MIENYGLSAAPASILAIGNNNGVANTLNLAETPVPRADARYIIFGFDLSFDAALGTKIQADLQFNGVAVTNFLLPPVQLPLTGRNWPRGLLGPLGQKVGLSIPAASGVGTAVTLYGVLVRDR